MMPPLKRISIFFVLAVAIYGLLVAPWPGLMAAYRAGFRAGANALFCSIGQGGSAAFEPLSSKDYVRDTRVVLRNARVPGAAPSFDIRCILVGYRPTAFLIALVLASPVPWSRRWRALLWGLLWVNAFVALRVWLVLLDIFSGPNPLAAFSVNPFWKHVLGMSVLFLFRDPATHYTAPAFIWLLVTFRRGDLRTLLPAKGSKGPPGGS